MAIISLQVQVNVYFWSFPTTYYVFSALDNESLLCLLGSRMFINLIDAGQSDVKDGSGNSVQPGGSTVSDIQFGDPSDPHSGEYTSQNVNDIYLILIS